MSPGGDEPVDSAGRPDADSGRDAGRDVGSAVVSDVAPDLPRVQFPDGSAGVGVGDLGLTVGPSVVPGEDDSLDDPLDDSLEDPLDDPLEDPLDGARGADPVVPRPDGV